jgi:uroporphyrinogen decarboxylase
MTKSDRVKAAIRGQAVDRPPVALWRHFPGDDQRPEDLARATVAFQNRYDFDFVKVTPASSFCLRDWGSQDRWMGTMEGTRDYTVYPVQFAEDWRGLRALDPDVGSLGAQLRCLRLIADALAGEVPFIQTIFNPLSQAKNLVGRERLPVHLRRYPDAVRAGLEVIAETTERFVAAARETGIAGVFFAVQHAQYGLLSKEEYNTFGRPYDLQVLEAAEGLWLNVLHLHGRDVMFDLLADYPVQVINWHDRETWPTLAEHLVTLSSDEQATGSKQGATTAAGARFRKDECTGVTRVSGAAQRSATSTVPAGHFWRNVLFILVSHTP